MKNLILVIVILFSITTSAQLLTDQEVLIEMEAEIQELLKPQIMELSETTMEQIETTPNTFKHASMIALMKWDVLAPMMLAHEINYQIESALALAILTLAGTFDGIYIRKQVPNTQIYVIDAVATLEKFKELNKNKNQ